MATISWVVMRHHKKADGTYNPKIRIIHNRTIAYMPTAIFTHLVRFKGKESLGRLTDKDVEEALYDKVKEMRGILNTNDYLIDDCENARAVVDLLKRKINERKGIDFLEFANKYLEGMKENGRKRIVFSLIKNLCRFTGTANLPIKQLTGAFLERFEAWLRAPGKNPLDGKKQGKKPLKDSTIETYMKAMQTLFNKMLATYNDYEAGDIIITRNPFKNYTPNVNTVFRKKALDVTVIRRIAAYDPPQKSRSGHEVFARDMFLLSFCLAGMNMADIFNCDVYKNGRLEYCRTKTKDRKKDRAFISLSIVDEAKSIFDKYRDPDGRRVFNIYQSFASTAKANEALLYGMKIMCRDLGIEPITFYAARHSFATIARNDCSVSMEDVALCLTHRSGFDMTDTYVKPDFTRVDRVIRKVMDFVFGKEKIALGDS